MRSGFGDAETQPVIVDAWDGVREYWFEDFRRMLVIVDGEEVLVVVDLYREPYQGRAAAGSLTVETANGTSVSYIDVTEELRSLLGENVISGEVVVLDTNGRRELVGARLRLPYHAIGLVDSYGNAWNTYVAIVRAFEGRDPEKKPLRPPEPVHRVYRIRGL